MPVRSEQTGIIQVARLDPFVSNAEWHLEFLDHSTISIKESVGGFKEVKKLPVDGVIDLGFGNPVFEVLVGEIPFQKGQIFRFKTFPAGNIEIYAPSMIEKAKKDELTPPLEVKVGYSRSSLARLSC